MEEGEAGGGARGRRQQYPPRRREDRQEVTERRDETGLAAEEEEREGGDTDRESPRGASGEVIRLGGGLPPPEENADLPDFTPECAHLLLQEFYGDFPHHNNGSHLDGGDTDNTIWQRRWRRLAAKLASWYAMPTGAVGCRFTAILAVECQGVIVF